jgi:hypothetical protein
MAALQRGDLRGTNEYSKGRLGTEYVVRCEGGDLAAYDPKNFYSEEQIEGYVADLVDGRRKFTEEIAAQGLRKDIREIAHKELDAIDVRTKLKPEPWAPAEEAAPSEPAEDRDPWSTTVEESCTPHPRGVASTVCSSFPGRVKLRPTINLGGLKARGSLRFPGKVSLMWPAPTCGSARPVSPSNSDPPRGTAR